VHLDDGAAHLHGHGGLTNGDAYSFTVSATNVVGTGVASSPSNTVTPAHRPRGAHGGLGHGGQCHGDGHLDGSGL
jgi:hypothetical protein